MSKNQQLQEDDLLNTSLTLQVVFEQGQYIAYINGPGWPEKKENHFRHISIQPPDRRPAVPTSWSRGDSHSNKSV